MSVYQITIHDAFGVPQVIPTDWISLEYNRATNNVGSLKLLLPSYNYPRSTFKRDGIILVERGINPNADKVNDTNTAWMINYVGRPPSKKSDVWEVRASCLNGLLSRRLVDYNAGNTYTEKLDLGDDMMKEIISENFGAGVTDTTRSIAAYLSIDADKGLGPSLRKSISRRYVLDVLQDICRSAYQAGTPLFFDISLVSLNPLSVIFKTYTQQIGVDLRGQTGGFPQVLIGPEYGNLVEAELEEDYSNIASRGIATGQGIGSIQAVARSDDSARIAESPFGLIEKLGNAENESSAAGVQDAADAVLKEYRPRKIVSGKLNNTRGFQYGINWNWGDRLTTQIYDDSYDCWVDQIHVKAARQGNQAVDTVYAVLRGES